MPLAALPDFSASQQLAARLSACLKREYNTQQQVLSSGRFRCSPDFEKCVIASCLGDLCDSYLPVLQKSCTFVYRALRIYHTQTRCAIYHEETVLEETRYSRTTSRIMEVITARIQHNLCHAKKQSHLEFTVDSITASLDLLPTRSHLSIIQTQHM